MRCRGAGVEYSIMEVSWTTALCGQEEEEEKRDRELN